MNILKQILSLSLKYKILLSIAVLLSGLGIYGVTKSPDLTLRTHLVARGSVIQEIGITGRIRAADTVDLAFEKSGRVTSIPVTEGQKVSLGSALIFLDSQELLAQRLRELASVQSAQAKLDQLVSGTRLEDIQIAQTTLDNAKRILDETRTKDTLDTAKTALNSAINAMVTVSDIQFKYTYTKFGEEYNLLYKKEAAMLAIYDQSGLGGAQTWAFLPLQSGLKAELAAALVNPYTHNGDALLSKIKTALNLSKEALDAAYGVAVGASASDTDKTTVTTSRTDVLAKIDAISTQEQAIITAENNVRAAQANLDLKKAPATQFDLDITKANLTQAQANLALIDAQLAKQTLRSPISGIVARIIARRGEIINPGIPVLSVISDAKFQIEANVPEADIAKVKINDSAKVTLDAYGQDIIFLAHVISIDQGETIIEGVATYKVKLEFNQNDPRILSGLTANVNILSAQRENVIFVPTRDISSKNGKKYVLLLINPLKQGAEEVEVTTGLKGSNGRMEIVTGLSEGDVIVE